MKCSESGKLAPHLCFSYLFIWCYIDIKWFSRLQRASVATHYPLVSDVSLKKLGAKDFLSCLPYVLFSLVKVKERIYPNIWRYMLVTTAIWAFFRFIFRICPCGLYITVLRQKWRLWKEEWTVVDRYTLYLKFLPNFTNLFQNKNYLLKTILIFICEYSL